MSNEDFTWYEGKADAGVVRQINRLQNAPPAGDELVKRFLRGFQPAGKSNGVQRGEYLWAKVMECFWLGSTMAQELCRKHGFDPDVCVNQRRI